LVPQRGRGLQPRKLIRGRAQIFYGKSHKFHHNISYGSCPADAGLKPAQLLPRQSPWDGASGTQILQQRSLLLGSWSSLMTLLRVSLHNHLRLLAGLNFMIYIFQNMAELVSGAVLCLVTVLLTHMASVSSIGCLQLLLGARNGFGHTTAW